MEEKQLPVNTKDWSRWLKEPLNTFNSITAHTAADILATQNPTVKQLQTNFNGDLLAVAAIYTAPFSQFIKQFNVGKTMGPEQLAGLLGLILNEFPNYTPDHFKLFFTRVIRGDYGISYDRLDGQQIMVWLRKFDLDLDEEITYERQKEAGRYKNELKDGAKGAGAFANTILAVTGLKAEDFVAKRIENDKGKVVEIKKRPKTKQEDLIQGWLKRFDELWMRQPMDIRELPGCKIIIRHDVHLDINAYLNYRLSEYNKKITPHEK